VSGGFSGQPGLLQGSYQHLLLLQNKTTMSENLSQCNIPHIQKIKLIISIIYL
jgi:hypothetical protein